MNVSKDKRKKNTEYLFLPLSIGNKFNLPISEYAFDSLYWLRLPHPRKMIIGRRSNCLLTSAREQADAIQNVYFLLIVVFIEALSHTGTFWSICQETV